MRVCRFSHLGSEMMPLLGIVEDGQVSETSGSMQDIFASQGGEGELLGGKTRALSEVRLLAPLPRPGKIVAAIVNTAGMLGGKDALLERPRLDMKAPSSVVGPGDEVRGPRSGVRPEVELAAVIGRKVTGATLAEAADAIFGYTILNDVTAPQDSRDDAYEAYRRDKATGEIRKVTMRGPLFRSKNHDTFCPMGPWIVTSDDLDVGDLEMSTEFGGKRVQEGRTSEYLFSPAELVRYVSQFLTLEQGDVLSCGSVGWTREAIGNFDPTEYLLPAADGVMVLRVEGIGELSNPLRLG